MADMDAMPNDVEVATIAVMGATGAGKSTFINLASDSRLLVSDGLQSCTSDVQIGAPFMLDNRMVTLIDTPGFDDTVKSEAEIVMLISDFLRVTYESGRKLHGVIFLHRISDNKVDGVARKNFRLFRKLCGDDTISNVVIATNMWGTIQPGIGEKRERELESSELFFAPVKRLGTEIIRHDNSIPSVQRIVRQVMGFTPKPLLIQRELVDERKMFAQTAAGKELLEELERRKAKHCDEIELIKSELEEILDEDEVSQDDVQEMMEAQAEAQGHIQRLEDEARKINDEHWSSRRQNETEAAKLLHEMDERETRLADTDLQTVVKRQTKKHQEEIERLQSQMEELLSAQETNHANEVHQLNDILASVRAELEFAQHERRKVEEEAQIGLEVTQSRHREAMAELQSNMDEIIASKDAKHHLEIHDLTSALDGVRRELDDAMREHEKLVAQSRAELEEQKADYQEELDRQRDEFHEELQGQESRYLEELDRQAEQHKKELDDLNRGFQEMLAAKDARHQLEARELSDRLGDTRGQLEESERNSKQADEDARKHLEECTAEWRGEMARLRSEMESAVSSKDEEIKALDGALAEARTRLQHVEGEKAKVEEESQAELSRLLAAHQQELEELQQHHSEEEAQLKNALATETAKHEDDIQQVIATLEEAKAQLEKSESEGRKALEERDAEKRAHQEKIQETTALVDDRDTTIQLLENRIAQQETRLKELDAALAAAKRSSGESQRTKVDVDPSVKDNASVDESRKTPRPKPTRGLSSYLPGWRR